jgi:hypothetical protein
VERIGTLTTVVMRARSFRTEVLQDDAGVADLSELKHYRNFNSRFPSCNFVSFVV